MKFILSFVVIVLVCSSTAWGRETCARSLEGSPEVRAKTIVGMVYAAERHGNRKQTQCLLEKLSKIPEFFNGRSTQPVKTGVMSGNPSAHIEKGQKVSVVFEFLLDGKGYPKKIKVIESDAPKKVEKILKGMLKKTLYAKNANADGYPNSIKDRARFTFENPVGKAGTLPIRP